MTITVTSFFAFYSFTIRTHVLPPEMVSFHKVVINDEDINFEFTDNEDFKIYWYLSQLI